MTPSNTERSHAAPAASVRARLKQQSDAREIPFDLALTRFGLERLLYRLSVSRHANAFILKGALLFALWYDAPTRPTRDADFLGFGSDDTESVREVFVELCNARSDDGVIFNPASVKVETIREGADYGGVRVTMLADLAGARIPLQIDIGYGDAVTPAALQAVYPVLLKDLAAPNLRVYPKVTVIAEKLQAIVVLGIANSRMKDYFDLWLLLGGTDIDSQQLRSAVVATFERRSTPVPAGLPTGLSDEFTNDLVKKNQWSSFISRNRLQAPPLAEVVATIHDNLARHGLL